MKRALVTGVTGQDGSYLAEYLESLGYEVHGLVRRSATYNLSNLKNTNVVFHYGDMSDELSLLEAVQQSQPDEVYNLAAQTFVKMAFLTPINSADITGLGCARLLEILRLYAPQAKFYQASSSEMFGQAPPPQSEATPFHPVSPYSTAKIYAYYQTKLYREAYGMFAVNGILFNHESPRRGLEFVSRKIARGVADIVKGKQTQLTLGNLQAIRDWGHAKDYVRAMHLMMQHDQPDDWVVSMDESHSVEQFVEAAFKVVDLDWREHVVINENHLRPLDVPHLQGDSRKIRQALGWKPDYTFQQLVEEMVNTELLTP